jgi:hypothetical protein
LSRLRTALAAGVSALALGAGLFAGLAPNASIASSHREAPLVAADPQVDNTDLYAFRSPSRPGYVSFVSSWIPFEEPAGGPNFYLWAEHTNYDINIDNDGDARADLIYRWTFDTKYRNPDTFLYNTGQVTSLGDPDLNIYQTYDLVRIDVDRHKTRQLFNNERVVPSNVGQSDDAFFLDLRVFDLLYGTDLSEAGDDTLFGFNVNTVALEVPRDRVRGPNDSVIGVWNTASRPSMRVQHADGTQTFSGKHVQVSRLGMPLVNEVVVPVGAKDYFNGSRPKDDEQFLAKVQDPELPRLISAVYPTFFPNVPDSDPGIAGIQRADLIQVFLTGVPGLNMPEGVEPAEMLRLNLDTPLCGRHGAPACSRLGVLGGDLQGFPNGRRLSDDTIDISLRAVMGVLLANHDAAAETLGDGVDANESMFLNHFPYVAYPHSGSDPSPHA